MQFKDLGLLVIDEEQRFGVRQKERLKQLQINVDFTTLSATPIPRTLHLALSNRRSDREPAWSESPSSPKSSPTRNH